MPTYRFTEVALYPQKTVKCTDCGKRLRRQRKFSQTHNPFNKNANGQIKTVAEIDAELSEQAKAWKAEPETCRDCAA